MSYAITCYHSDYTIAKTKISISALGLNYELVPEAQDANGDDASWEKAGFTYNAKFTATPASGSKFVRWVYRVGSQTASVQYSTANPFTYTGGQDIWIRAEGEIDNSGGGDAGDDTSEEWILSSKNWTDPVGTEEIGYSFGLAGRLRCISTVFEHSGTVKIYSEGSYDALGYLSTSSGWNNSTGKPTTPLVSDDNSGDGSNFSITYEVTAGVTYYIWYRHKSITATGKITVYLVSPEESETTTVEPWDWEIGTGSDRDKAYQAITSNGDVDDFSYSVWNELVDKVLEVIEADPNESVWFTESNNGTVYLSENSTKMTSSDKVMTAKRFNALRYNIGSRGSAPSTGIADKSTGETVYGEYFIILADCINGWINNL